MLTFTRAKEKPHGQGLTAALEMVKTNGFQNPLASLRPPLFGGHLRNPDGLSLGWQNNFLGHVLDEIE